MKRFAIYTPTQTFEVRADDTPSGRTGWVQFHVANRLVAEFRDAVLVGWEELTEPAQESPADPAAPGASSPAQ